MTYRLLRRNEVEQMVGLKRSAIYDRMAKDRFPKPIPLAGTRTVRWRSDQIEDWMRGQAEA